MENEKKVFSNLEVPCLNSDKLKESIKNKKLVLKKGQKKLRIKTKDMEIDDIFRDLETTYDKDGNIIDTRFNEETQKFIRDFLEAKKVEFDDTGYLSLRNACYNLKMEDRFDLCKMLELKTNHLVDADGRYRKVGNNIFNKSSNKVRAIGGAVLGAGAGLAIQSTKQDLITGLNSENIVGNITESLNGNFVTNALSGPVSDVLSGPIKGVVTGINSIANIGGGAVAGIALGIASKSVVNAFNNITTRINSNKKYAEFLNKDAELYENENKEELQKMENNVKSEHGLEEENHSLAA